MNTIIIPLILIMSVALIIYTVATFSSMIKRKIDKLEISFFHASVLLVIIGIFYMSGISSKLTYQDVSYSMMHIHTGLGYIALIILIVHAIFATIIRRKNKKSLLPLSKSFVTINLILWILLIISYGITLYIGILAGMN